MVASVLLRLNLDLGQNGLGSKVRSTFLSGHFNLKVLPNFFKYFFKADLSTPLGVGQTSKPFKTRESSALLSLRLDKFTTFSDTKNPFNLPFDVNSTIFESSSF